MLPGFLKGTYAIYKEDTDSVASWLASTARRCGYSLDLLTATTGGASDQKAPKKKKRKKAKTSKPAEATTTQQKSSTPPSSSLTTYTIAVKDFVPLAEYIVAFQKPPVKVPSSFVGVLNRAIALRKKHNSWFGQSSKDDGHNFFLGVLERVRETLKSRMLSDTVDDLMTRPSASSDTKSTDTGHIGNAFAGLTLEESSDEFLNAVPSTSAANAPAEADDGARYQAERLQKVEEQYLAAHCLLADINTIREHIKQLWGMYRDGLMDLQSVSITTNTAVELVRHMQEDYDKNFPEHADFEGLINTFYIAQCVHQGHDPNHRERRGDIINMAMYDIADEVLLPAYTILASLSDVVAPGQIPLYKPGHFGFRDLSTEWSQKSSRDKLEDDKLVLFEAFSGFSAIAKTGCFAEDELIRGVREMAPGKKVPLWLTFAVQSFLDVQHVMGPHVAQGIVDLQTAARHIGASLNQNFKFHEKLRINTWDVHNDRVLKQIQNIITTWVAQDNVKKIIERSLLRNPTIAAQIAGEPFKLLKQYPSLCGIWLYSLRYLMQDAGITFANAWGSVMYSAHLYNAARQQKLVNGIWKDMELALLLQGNDRMFIGDRPKQPEDYLKRFNLCMGYSATSLAKNARNSAPKASAKGPRGLEHPFKLAELFAKRYPHNGRSLSTDLDAVEKHVKAEFSDPENFELSDLPDDITAEEVAAKVTAKYKSKDKLSAGIFLEGLANAIQSEGMQLSFDYFRLHRSCWMLLRSVKDHCADQLRELFGPSYLEKETQLPFVVGYLFMAAFSAEKVGKDVGVEARSKVFIDAAEAIEDIICAKIIEEYFNYAVDWEV
ncbi:hypothetical protein D6C97_07087 [Aureobasidium pullulans]|nr:hypothetical protein D6C97_07087 [Aureobasidium pullulans]